MMSDDRPLQRCAILGTASSWTQCPWGDTDLLVLGLNDAYVLGYPRADVWFDLHAFHAMTFHTAGKPVDPRATQVGAYLRPAGHLEWLKSRATPVYLQQGRPDWPSSRTFPREAVLAYWAKFWPWRVDRQGIVTPGKDYEVSTPAWMYMWAVMEGFTEIHIYGVHLATEWEYIQQRPNLEFLIGVAAGLGVKTVLPTAVPICQSPFRYAYEPKADLAAQAIQREMDLCAHDQQLLDRAAKAVPWYRPRQKQDFVTQARRLKVERMDLGMQLQHVRTPGGR